jgi:uncharacterized membrane protein
MWVVIIVLVVVLVGAAAFAVSRRKAPDHAYEQDRAPDVSAGHHDPHHGEVGGRGSGPVGGGF